MQQQLNEVAKALLEAKRIAIISHKNPDGDTLGSQLALGGALKELGKDVVLYNKDKVASKFNFIAGADQVVQYHDGMELPETVVFVDCAEPQLAGFTVEDDVLMGKTIINIDHHASNKHYGKWNYVISTAGANCQNIYHVIGAIGGTITDEIATALYTGISTDTGNFMFDNVSSETLRIAADLKDIGANTDAVRLKLYESSSKKKIEMDTMAYNLKLSTSKYFFRNKEVKYAMKYKDEFDDKVSQINLYHSYLNKKIRELR